MHSWRSAAGRLLLSLWWGAGLCVSRAAATERDDVLHVFVSPCGERVGAIDRDELLAIAASELAPRRIELVQTPDADTLRIELCGGNTIKFDWSDGSAARELSVAELAQEARTRTLALALAEFADELAQPARARENTASAAKPAASIELARPPKASDTSASAATSGGAIERAPSSRAVVTRPDPAPGRLQGGIGAETRVFLAPRTLTYGPRMTLRIRRVRVGAAMLMGSADSDLGDARVGLALASIGYELWRIRELLAVVASGEMGAAWAKGLAADQDTRSHSRTVIALAALLSAVLGVPLGRALFGELLVSGGFTYGLAARAGGREAASTYGPCMGLALGLIWGKRGK